MLSINPINNFRFINNNFLNKKQNVAPKLAPIAQDTVSFTGARNLNRSLLESFDNTEVCEEVAQNAKAAESELKKTLSRALSQYTSKNAKTTSDNIIEPISVRIKSPTSIREKVASVLEESIVEHRPDRFIDPKSAKDIKRNLGDIVGARIVLKQANSDKNAKIIDSLIEQIRCNALNIKKIELIVPDGDPKNYPYISYDVLEKMRNEVNHAREKRGKEPIDIDIANSKSGYIGLHLDVDLSTGKMYSDQFGYTGEIQILGYNVANFKEVEDLCYKTIQNKSVKEGHVAYLPFNKLLTKYLVDKEDKTNFSEYTRKAYNMQVLKDMNAATVGNDGNPAKDNTFPSLAQCAMSNKLDKSLDYNTLALVKKHCDELEKILDED